MLHVVDMLGRNIAQPRNGASLKISICPEKMTTFSSSGGCLAGGLRPSCFSPCPFCVGWCAWYGSYVLGLFGLQRNLCGDKTAELHQLSKNPDTGIIVLIKLVVVEDGDVFLTYFLSFSISFASSLIVY